MTRNKVAQPNLKVSQTSLKPKSEKINFPAKISEIKIPKPIKKYHISTRPWFTLGCSRKVMIFFWGLSQGGFTNKFPSQDPIGARYCFKRARFKSSPNQACSGSSFE